MERAMTGRRIWLVAVVIMAAAYGCDYLWLRYRMATSKAGEAFGRVTFFDSTTMKNGKVEVFYDQPLTEVCVHSIFPQVGDRPCWYASSRTVKSID